MRIGFIGLGLMGASMASNLQRAGHALVVSDLRRAAADALVAAGATWASSPKDVAETCDVIFTSLPGPREFEAVTLAADGLVAGLRRGAVHFDLTTNAPALVRRLHAVYADKGCHLLDAPVSGGPKGAKSGRMAIWVGGDETLFARHKPLLDAMGDAARYIGPIGAGSVAKLVHNCAGYAVQTALAEVMTLGVKAGVEPVALWQAVRTGALGRARTLDRLADQFLPATYEPPAFTLKLGHKDMTLATDLAREVGVPMRVANLAYADMTEAMNRGWGDLDSRAPMQLQNERAKVQIAADPARIEAVLADDPPFKG